jgi:DNA-directed RNA polymerase specialized sigma24 family protein
VSLSVVVTTLISERKIPVLGVLQMQGLLHYLFAETPRDLCIQVAEVAYRYDHDHPHAMDIYLASVLPLAQRVAHRRATRILVQPSDWTIEKMYDGAVEAVIKVWQTGYRFQPIENAFRRYLLSAMAKGALRAYFRKQDTRGIRTVADIECFKMHYGTDVEKEVITWDLLDRVATFPQLRPPVRATLECIRVLGPHYAIKEHAFTKSGDPDKWKRNRCIRPVLDPEVIANAMGISKAKVHQYLHEARIILRQAFNQDGDLFNR